MASMRVQRAVWALAGVMAAGTASAAHTDFNLRFLKLDTSSPWQVSDVITVTGADRFNNGAPLSGISYQPLFNGSNNGAAVTGTYAVSGSFGANAELSGASSDFLGQQFGVGGLTFSSAGAISSTNNLTPSGYGLTSVALQPVVVSGTADGLAARGSSLFLRSVWDFAVPQAGESILLALAGTGNPNYVDRLQLRFGSNYQTGVSSFSFEQQSKSGSVITRNILGTVDLADATSGFSLSQVHYLSLTLERAMPSTTDTNPVITASVGFYDSAIDGTGGLLQLGSYTFSTTGTTFQTAGTAGNFSSVFVGANFIDPLTAVPEPGSWALMLAGGVALLGLSRHRNARH